mmetsp:Transcript_89169/g.154527  ORF Transcript_89169/g.154527 Transcript_89169/m.154527 type:complete len:93 (+) Transcript_89169:288-566(+)
MRRTWIKVPSLVGIYGNEQADRLADEGVRKHGVPLQGDPGRGVKRPAEGQCLRRLAAELEDMAREAAVAASRPHQGVGVSRVMFLTCVDTEE